MAKKDISLTHEFESAWTKLTQKELKTCYDYSENYKKFLDTAKTEREATVEIIRQAKSNGYKDINDFITKKTTPKKGDKIYAVNRGKAVLLFNIGENPIASGINVVGTHIDVPRIDLKPFPIYEDSNLAFLKTHYYGGIKKYQWATIPLAIHGVIFKKDGEKVDVVIGEDESEPVLQITDILPHLAQDQYKKLMGDGITGEQLNLLIGNIPVSDKDVKDKVKYNILKILNKKYGITESDFLTSELEIVPAGKARDLGFDASMILGYGHDDRSCSYAALSAIFETTSLKKTACSMFMDKEEVGSHGNTSSASKFFENTLAELISLQEKNYTDIHFRRSISNTQVLSADVGAAYDPNYPQAYDKRNSSQLGAGIQLVKYTGVRGKSGCSDANAEFVSEVARIFDSNNVVWQIGELGKVDQGGGGTIAFILADANADVVDCGIPVLSMHAPYEAISKVDLYMAHKAYYAFLNR